MFAHYLFPHRYQRIGWFIFIPAILAGILWLIIQPEWAVFDRTVLSVFTDTSLSPFSKEPDLHPVLSWQKNNILDELICLLIILGGVLVAFSKEKVEDEFIAKIRLESLVWATYLNYAILFLTIVFVYSFGFFWVLVFNMFTILLFFIVRFRWVLHRSLSTTFAL